MAICTPHQTAPSPGANIANGRVGPHCERMKLEHRFADALPNLSHACEPTPVSRPAWVFYNRELGEQIGLSPSEEILAALAGNQSFADSQPIAQAYSGHQFGQFNPGLGDGRAHLLGEFQWQGQVWDLALKGSGRTPYSRNGDGRASLGPMLREVLISEHLYALGIPTTRSLAVVATGESVLRQFGPEPGAILTRIAASHIRVGSFEHLAARQQIDDLRALFEFTCQRHAPDITDPMDLLAEVCQRQARLIAQWMSVGFIHGVMNTDNMTLSGESVDFGPCAFMDHYQPDQVYSSIDRQGRYAYKNQPGIGQWNLTRLAEALLALYPETEREAQIERAKSILNAYEQHYTDAYEVQMTQKLGLEDCPEQLLNDWLELLANQRVDWTLSHALLYDLDPWLALFSDPEAALAWRERWMAEQPDEAMSEQHNPWSIARNHQVDEALKAAEDGDLAPFESLLARVVQPFERVQDLSLIKPAAAGFQATFRTYCGT